MAHKRKNETGFTRCTFSLPTSLVERLDAACIDPLTGKPVYGKRSQLITTAVNGILARAETKIEKTSKEFIGQFTEQKETLEDGT